MISHRRCILVPSPLLLLSIPHTSAGHIGSTCFASLTDERMGKRRTQVLAVLQPPPPPLHHLLLSPSLFLSKYTSLHPLPACICLFFVFLSFSPRVLERKREDLLLLLTRLLFLSLSLSCATTRFPSLPPCLAPTLLPVISPTRFYHHRHHHHVWASLSPYHHHRRLMTGNDGHPTTCTCACG